MRRQGLVSVCGVCAVLAGGAVPLSRGDLVVLRNGEIHAGRAAEEAGSLNILTGTPHGLKTVTVPWAEVRNVWRGEEEARAVRDCPTAGLLKTWSAGYFWAGLEESAAGCIRRALELEATLDADPLQEGDPSFRSFWNRRVLAYRELRLREAGADLLLETARWAKQADLSGEAIDYLRRAWRADRDSVAVRRIAEEWNVYLGPWRRLDLTPGLVGGMLLSDTIQDEELTVTALPGMTFLVLPYRCSTVDGPQTLHRGSLRDPRDLYGFAVVQFRTARSLAPLRFVGGAVYERLDLKIAAGGREPTSGPTTRRSGSAGDRFEGIPLNTRGPRLPGPERPFQEPSRDRFREPLPVGGFALILEIPRNTEKYVVDWADGGRDEVDIAFLRRVPQTIHELGYRIESPAESSRDPPAGIKAVADKLACPSAAMAVLAARRIFRFREEIGSNLPPKWLDPLEAAVVRAGARPEPELREAVWAGLSARRISEATAAALAAETPQVQSEWIALLRARVSRAGPDFNGEAAAALLMAILRTDNEVLCGQALDVLMGLKEQVDWGLAEKASQPAQSLALRRVRDLADPVAARRLLRAVLKDVRPATADEIAAQAGRLGVRVLTPDDVLLTQWLPNSAAAEQIGLLKVMEAIPLGDALYSHAVDRIIQEATAATADPAVQAAAMRMLVAQARYQRDPLGGSGPRGGFPLQVSLETRDVLVDGLTVTATRGPADLRLDGLAELLRAGYAVQAAKSLRAGCRDDLERLNLLRQLAAADPEIRRSHGYQALLGQFLRPGAKELVTWVTAELVDLERRCREREEGNCWLLVAAVKAGVDFRELAGLCYPLETEAAYAAFAWLGKLGHLTRQDSMRLQAAGSTADFYARLEQIDLRRSSIVDGRYGAVAVVEWVESQSRPGAQPSDDEARQHFRWSVPRRVTLLLPPIQLKTVEEDGTVAALWEGLEIGRGQIKTEGRIRFPLDYAPRLENPESVWLGRLGWGWPNLLALSPTEGLATGPAVLASRGASTTLAPGRLNLDVGGLLAEAMRAQKVWSAAQVRQAVPASCPVSVRYAAFGSYYGTGPRRAAPSINQTTPGQGHLLNVLVVLERMGD